MTTLKVEATVAGIRTEMIGSEDAPGDHTTTTGQNSWQHVFLPLELTKEEANPDPMTGAITAGAAVEAVDTIDGNHTVMDT